MLKLSKTIPAYRKTIKFRWCVKNFTTFDESFRRIKPKVKRCFWCHEEFEDGDSLALANPEKSLNKLLCHKCADELLSSQQTNKGGTP